MSAVDLTPSGGGTLLFMHVPKTGGTTLRAALTDAYERPERTLLYGSHAIRGSYTSEAFRDLPASERAAARLVYGHFSWGLHESVPGASAYAAVVREPVERVISVYDHYRHHKGLRFHLLTSRARAADRVARQRVDIERDGLDLESWIFERAPREVDNQVVRQLTGMPQVPFGACPDTLLDEALDNVRSRFVRLLVLERLADDVTALARDIGRPLRLGRRRKVNRRRQRLDAVPAAVRARIAELNRLDIALYERAREGTLDVG